MLILNVIGCHVITMHMHNVIRVIRPLAAVYMLTEGKAVEFLLFPKRYRPPTIYIFNEFFPWNSFTQRFLVNLERERSV